MLLYFPSCVRESLSCTCQTGVHAVDSSTAQHSTAQHSTAQHSTAQHSTAQQLVGNDACSLLTVAFFVMQKKCPTGKLSKWTEVSRGFTSHTLIYTPHMHLKVLTSQHIVRVTHQRAVLTHYSACIRVCLTAQLVGPLTLIDAAYVGRQVSVVMAL